MFNSQPYMNALVVRICEGTFCYCLRAVDYLRNYGRSRREEKEEKLYFAPFDRCALNYTHLHLKIQIRIYYLLKASSYAAINTTAKFLTRTLFYLVF